MKDVDCTFLRPCPPTRSRIVEQPAISTAELVKLWYRAGVVTHYPRRHRTMNLGDALGLISLAAAVAWCFGYYFGH